MQLWAFEGEWSIERWIEDVRGGRAGRFSGKAVFERGDSGLLYCETGTLQLDGGVPVTASRRYSWCDGGAGAIDVRFEDGRIFHRFYADEAAPSAVHFCAPDQYRVRYDFAAWPRWEAEWRVRGPRKNYGIRSAYRPAGQTVPNGQ